jgi:hypothetical protein
VRGPLVGAFLIALCGVAQAQVTCQTYGNTTNCNGSLAPAITPVPLMNFSAPQQAQANANLQNQQAALAQQQAELVRAQTEAIRQQTVAAAQQPAIASQQPAITASNMARVCRGQDVRYYDNCVGVVVYPNGNIYSGEFRNGKRDGWGMIRILAPGVPSDNYIGSSVASTYVGQFADDRINGVGTWTTDTGNAVVGQYVNNRLVKPLSGGPSP